MGNANQILFLEKYKDALSGPFLEVGSKNYGSTQNLRPFFADKGQYVGVDLEAGDGVDLVLDLVGDFEQIDAQLGGQRFGSIFCFDVLEHCQHPFKMAENLTRLLKEDGTLCVSAPFSWKVHAYPNDYWRFTIDGIKQMFSPLKFDLQDCFAFSPNFSGLNNITKDVGKISFSFGRHHRQGHTMRGWRLKL